MVLVMSVLSKTSLHQRALEYLAVAQDLSMVESKHSAVLVASDDYSSAESLFSGETQERVVQNAERLVWLIKNRQILQLYMHAASNSMNVVLQDIRGSLLDHSKAADIVGSLCSSTSRCMELTLDQGGQAPEELSVQIKGLVPALSQFTAAAWHALQQHNLSNWHHQQQRQQPQQDDPGARRKTAIQLVRKLLELWTGILMHTRTYRVLDVSFDTALPALIGLTAALPPLLQKARAFDTSSSSSSSSTSSNTLLLLAYESILSRAAAASLALAEHLVLTLSKPRQQTTVEGQQQQLLQQQQQQQQQQQIYLTEQLPELLLQLLAYPVGHLHAGCGGVSQALQDRHAGGATADATQEQAQQQQQPFAGCVVPQSHLALLQALGLDHHSKSDAAKPDDMPDLVQQYAMTLRTLSTVILARCRGVPQVSSSSIDAGQRQQQGSYSVLPSHLLVPAVKVLIEVVLLLPVGNSLAVHACSLQSSLLLLHTAVTAAVRPEQGQHTSPLCPWLQLPAAVAAGLLQPVVAQLSQAVMYCLLQTDQQQQHQMKTERLALLHSYGSLLVTVCQSVEPKHIATVLKSQSAPDLLITLAAIEAVIRAQACHLAPEQWKHKQQQQPQQVWPGCRPDVYSIAELEVILSITAHRLEHAPLLLLPFVSIVVGAVRCLTCELDKERSFVPLVASDSVDCKLSARLCTLLTTAMKVSTSAATAAAAAAATALQDLIAATATAEAAGEAAAHCAQSHLQGIINSFKVIEVAGCCFFAAKHITARSSTSSYRVQTWSVVLLGRALRAAACGLSGCVASHPDLARAEELASSPAASSAAAANDRANDLEANEIAINLSRPILVGLADACDIAMDILVDLAAHLGRHEAPAASPAAAGPPLMGHHKHSVDSRSDSCCRQLPLLLQQIMQVKALIRSTLESALIEAGIPASSLARMRYDNLISTTRQHLRSLQPSIGLLANLSCSSRSLCDLADTVLTCSRLQICCNNPLCTNVTKLSEWQLVCGKACVCAGCGLARYCSRGCQEQHWRHHKHACHNDTCSA